MIEMGAIGGKFRALRDEVAGLFVGRDEVVDAGLLGLATQEHVCFLGDPGCAKSAVVDEIQKRIGGCAYYWVQLFGETAPADVFGQVSLAALENEDKHRRNTAGFLPAADVAFLDEIFQARSTILVGANAIMQERRYRNGCEQVDVPLVTMFGASNFYPEDPQLIALWDRFTMRLHVAPLQSDADLRKLLFLPEPPSAPAPVISMQEVRSAREAVMDVGLPPEVIDAFLGVLAALAVKEPAIRVSDRRKRKAMRIVQGNAFLAGREKAEVTDLNALRYVLWSRPEEIGPVAEVLAQYRPVEIEGLRAVVGALGELLKPVRHMQAKGHTNSELMPIATQALGKINDTMREIDDAAKRAAGHPESLAAVREARKAIQAYQAELWEMMGMLAVSERKA
jgi:MoxR-like ATPase